MARKKIRANPPNLRHLRSIIWDVFLNHDGTKARRWRIQNLKFRIQNDGIVIDKVLVVGITRQYSIITCFFRLQKRGFCFEVRNGYLLLIHI